MNKNTRIQALADLAVKRGDYRYGSKNYKAYVSSLLDLDPQEIERRYIEAVEQNAAHERARKEGNVIESDRQAEWRRNNSKVVTLRLMLKSDADILAALEGKQATQEIRRLIRLGIEAEKNKEDTH